MPRRYKNDGTKDNINIFLKLEKTVSVNVDTNMLFKDFINEIIFKNFPMLAKIAVDRIYIVSKSILDLSPVYFETKLKDLDYFFNNNTYTIKVRVEKPKVLEKPFIVLQELFEYLKKFVGYEHVQVIVSLFSSNTTYVADKNLMQQFQYTHIQPGKKIIFYILIDITFFGKNVEFYNLIQNKELKVSELKTDIDSSIIKKFTLEKPYIRFDNPRYVTYYELFETYVEPKINNSNVTYYVLNVNLTPEVREYISSYNKIFNIYLFGGQEFVP
jgi:hypothetical protein